MMVYVIGAWLTNMLVGFSIGISNDFYLGVTIIHAAAFVIAHYMDF